MLRKEIAELLLEIKAEVEQKQQLANSSHFSANNIKNSVLFLLVAAWLILPVLYFNKTMELLENDKDGALSRGYLLGMMTLLLLTLPFNDQYRKPLSTLHYETFLKVVRLLETYREYPEFKPINFQTPIETLVATLTNKLQQHPARFFSTVGEMQQGAVHEKITQKYSCLRH